MRFPIANPHAAEGPNIKPKAIGKTFATRTSVIPGIRGNAVLKAINVAAYMAAHVAQRTIILVLFHMEIAYLTVISSFLPI
jgi:hypothetical protein